MFGLTFCCLGDFIGNGFITYDQIDKILDFTVLANFIDLANIQDASGPDKGGRPAYPTEAMLKVLLLQVMYNTSDERTQDAVADRLSFRRFAGFSLEDDTPDNATICRFRGLLVDLNLDLLKEVNDQLDQYGMRLRKGTLIDATIFQANAKAPKGGEVSERDPEAGWTQKAGKYHFGYKAHVAMDQTSGMINKVRVTSADVHDSLATYECLDEKDEKAYADKAYDNDEIRATLRHNKIKPRLMHRAYASDSAKRKERKASLNKGYGKIRCGVEKYFGTLKRTYGARQARYLTIAKNQLHMDMMAIVYNLRRVINIAAEKYYKPAWAG